MAKDNRYLDFYHTDRRLSLNAGKPDDEFVPTNAATRHIRHLKKSAVRTLRRSERPLIDAEISEWLGSLSEIPDNAFNDTAAGVTHHDEEALSIL